MDNKYLIRKQNQRKQLYRFRLGLFQFINKPILNLIWLALVPLIYLIIKGKNFLIDRLNLPSITESVFIIAINLLAFLLPIILVLYLIETLANRIAQRDENALMVAFSSKALRNGCPILVGKKRIKNSNVITREYYSNISLDVWNEHKNAIADALNAHFVEEIQYGGKGNNNGKIIVIKTAKGRKPIDRGTLYDEEF